jgi:hypothetical protein
VSRGADDRRGFVQRIWDARQAYKGPFTGEHVEKAVLAAGYALSYEPDGEGTFLIFRKDGCRPIPVNPAWDWIWDDDPIFRCLQRDLGLSRGKLRTRLNEARHGTLDQ